MTPLMLCVINGNIRALKLLLLSGADKNIKGSKDKTALDIALSEET